MLAGLKPLSLALVCAALACLAPSPGGTLPASEPQNESVDEAPQRPETLVVVRITGGREFHGAIDARSDDARLVLRRGTPAMRILRSLAWDDIAAARHGEEELTRDQLRALALAEATPAPPLVRPADADDAPPLPPPAPARVVTCEIDAWLANWDGDLEYDGLVLEVRLADAWGRPVNTGASVTARLVAPRFLPFHEVPATGGVAFRTVGQWQRVARAEEFDAGALRLRLPLAPTTAERDVRLANYGLLQVQVAVPGSGAWNRALDGVRLRPWSPTRDWLEHVTGQRLLPGEHYGP